MAYVSLIFLLICSINDNLVKAKDTFSNKMQVNCMGNSTDFSTALYQTYQVNVISVVSLLSSTSSPDSFSSPQFYYSTSMGKSPYKAYGYYLCRADLKPRLCNQCLLKAEEALGNQTQVPGQRYFPQCFAFNDKCLLTYANHSISSVYEKGLVLSSYAVESAKVPRNYQLYNQTLSNTLKDLIKEAALGNWTKDFMSRVDNVPGSDEKIYSLMQCFPRISASNCSKCLSELYSQIPICCSGSQGGVALHSKCMMKFDSQSFFGGASHDLVFHYLHVNFFMLVSIYLICM